MGGSENEGKTTSIEVTFKIDQVLNIENAREIIVDITSELIKVINSNPRNKNFFDPFPVGLEIPKLCVISNFHENSKTKLFGLNIDEGKIAYMGRSPDPNSNELVYKKTETFEEAKKILADE